MSSCDINHVHDHCKILTEVNLQLSIIITDLIVLYLTDVRGYARF